jgi:thioredoxin-dependent peroxiredoxin
MIAMRLPLFPAVAAAALIATAPALAALAPGAKAPDFNTKAAMAGKTTDFSLSRQLKKGPVFLPGGFHIRLHGRGQSVCRGDR